MCVGIGLGERSFSKGKLLLKKITRTFFISLLFLVIFYALTRAFFYEPFRIPSDSMMPTVLNGDVVLVQKYAYGLRLPLTHHWLVRFKGPSRGDVVVFSFPKREKLDFIKRVIGLPGDVIAMKSGMLFVNGASVTQNVFELSSPDATDHCIASLDAASQAIVPNELLPIPYFRKYREFDFYVEKFADAGEHLVQHTAKKTPEPDFEITVPADNYFVMGDNREHSSDSRKWGMVSRDLLIGEATNVSLSLNTEKLKCAGLFDKNSQTEIFRWNRLWREIK